MARLGKAAAVSSWYGSDPQPPMPRQGRYVNAVVRLESELSPSELLTGLHQLEREFGRVRGAGKNEARTLDLDIVAAEDENGGITAAEPTIPHSRMERRSFVLLPLAELAPIWRHPISGKSLSLLIAELPADKSLIRLS